MDNNGTNISKIPRKTYSRELLRSLKNSELSNLWPKSLDKTCINSHNQWDPVKSFENNKTTDTKRNIFAESKSGYRNNDKSKDDISLRPERRRWNDGCQVTNNNKRNSDDSHSNSYRKSYQNTVPNCGGGDYDRSRFNRNTTRNSKLKENEANIKENKAVVVNNKPDKSSRNNSNLEERKEEKEDQPAQQQQQQQQKANSSKNCNNNSRFSRTNEPEWFLDGPENCEETIELRGITANDNEMLHFKAYSTKPDESAAGTKAVIGDGLMLALSMDKASGLTDNCISPKREGSRFQDIFLKEKIINNLNESKDVENILKAVLSDNVSKSDVERLNNVSKPLPNGVLTLEEIEKNMTSGSILMDRATSKSTTIDTLNSFETSLKSLLSSDLSSPSQDNSKVVNWLSGLNLHGKDPDMEKTPQYNDSHNFCCINPMINPPNQLPSGYSKYIPTLQPPPGLPLVLNNNQLQHQHHQQQQQQQQQQSQMIQQQQQHQNKLLQSNALMKQLQMSQSNNMNHNIQSRNILPFMFPTHNPSNEFENFLNEKYKMHNQPANNMSNEVAAAAAAAAAHIDQNVLSNYLMKNKHAQMNHNMINHDNRNHLLTMNGPPGLTNLNLLEKNMIMQPRPIVKTSTPQLFDTANMNDFNKNFPSNFLYHRNQLPTNNNNNNNNNNNPPSNPPPPPPSIPTSHLPIHMRELLKQQQQQQQQQHESSSSLACRFADNINLEMNKCNAAAVQMNQIDVYNSMRNREILQKQAMLLHNNYPYRQSFIPPGAAHEMNMQNSSSNKMLANLFNVSSSTLPPLPQQAKYADQIETENI